MGEQSIVMSVSVNFLRLLPVVVARLSGGVAMLIEHAMYCNSALGASISSLVDDFIFSYMPNGQLLHLALTTALAAASLQRHMQTTVIYTSLFA